MRTSFREEVEAFREWAIPYKQRNELSGEWECNYHRWDALWTTSEEMMAKCAVDLPDEGASDDLLYAIGRDNEDERLRERLLNYPKLLRHLAIHGVDSADADAKWQIVVSVAEAGLFDAVDRIRPYLYDDNEYVRRRSLLAIAPLSPSEAEVIAKKWMEADYEYSRIAGINVLDIVSSGSLKKYLEKHSRDPSVHVRSNVEQIRVRRESSNSH